MAPWGQIHFNCTRYLFYLFFRTSPPRARRTMKIQCRVRPSRFCAAAVPLRKADDNGTAHGGISLPIDRRGGIFFYDEHSLLSLPCALRAREQIMYIYYVNWIGFF
ncbi:hypothetical protein niasHS_013416 [Heterodera schachtii]|uniref:Uncharacterized protein n=1 Tax=Heterodera schachtii TaxID=97005 RepID=A0ABD2I7R5_HETSC